MSDNTETTQPQNNTPQEIIVYSAKHFFSILERAFLFTCEGKGAARHGGNINVTPLEKQPWVMITEKTRAGFPLGQVLKKCMELDNIQDPDEKLKEIYGAISYLSFAAMYIESEGAKQKQAAQSSTSSVAPLEAVTVEG